jgi:Right handed beta helix region
MARLDHLAPRAQPASRLSSLVLLFGAVLLSGLSGLSGCDDGNDRECDSRVPCESGFICDLGSNQCVEPSDGTTCFTSEHCTNELKPFCKESIYVCVDCLTQQSLKECGYRGVCDVKETCLPCQGDGSCLDDDTTSDVRNPTVCLRTGACAKEKEVAYVNPASDTPSAQCTYLNPCTTLVDAVATKRPVIRLGGDVTLTAALQLDYTVAIYGAKEGDRTTITLSGAGSLAVGGTGTVELRDLQLSGGAGNAIAVTGGTPKLDLDNVDLIDNGGLGVSAGTASLRVTKSVIDNNEGGGISSAAVVYLENNIITNNGSGTSVAGGVLLSSNAAENVVRFNTFGNNQSMGTNARAISCGAAAVKLSSNIFAGAGTLVSGCSTTHSLFPVGTTVTAPDLAGNPQFLSTTRPAGARPASSTADDYPYYHLMETSPAVGKGEPSTPAKLSNDIDGDSRLDTDREIGADEL